MAETIAQIYGLDSFADVFHTYIRELPANILYRLRDDNNKILCRYIYYNKENLNTFLIQYGNPTRYDADLYIDNQKYIISSVKKNNKYEIIGFDNINSIEKTDSILKKEVYVNVMELKIDDYLIGELLNMDVYEKNIFIGKVTEVLYNKKYTYIRCNKLIIPLIDNYLKEINLEKNIIYVKNIGELNEN